MSDDNNEILEIKGVSLLHAKAFIFKSNLHDCANGKDMGDCAISARAVDGKPVFVAYLPNSSTCTLYGVVPECAGGVSRPKPTKVESGKWKDRHMVIVMLIDGSKPMNLQNHNVEINGEARAYKLLFADLDDAEDFCELYYQASFATDEQGENGSTQSNGDLDDEEVSEDSNDSEDCFGYSQDVMKLTEITREIDDLKIDSNIPEEEE